MSRPITVIWGVGDERARLLARLGIHTVQDLLLRKPRRYEDRRKFLSIRELQLGEPATVRGKIIAAGAKTWKKGLRGMFECVLDDGTGHLYLRWWQSQSWMEDYYSTGREFLAFGKTESLRPRAFEHPETELLEPGEDEFIHVNRIVPIHPLTEGLTARAMRTIVWRALEAEAKQASSGIGSDSPHQTAETLTLLRSIHFPDEMSDVESARQLLALGEFIELQKQIQQRRRNFESKAKALPCGGENNRLIKPFLSQLGFKLTAAQARVLREIRADMSGEHPMRRLLQGDVGSGKTAVAACAALMAAESGFNVALMSPTEILADQHYRNFERWFKSLGVKVEMQTGSRKSGEDGRSGTEDGKSAGSSIFIGTHALLTSGFDIPRLGLVIIDEQHKFGVTQREELLRKGNYPHLLVMTATPIPRTLGLTLYGDLDISLIDELPAGRGQIKTFVRMSDKLPKVWEFIRGKLKSGRQAYVVYPRVEEQDTTNGIKAVTKECENVQRSIQPFRVGLIHGRLNSAEKENVMSEFRANRIHALLATSLIEVGVDVPNATVMLIENAESFGLAQLHQLRGRIGRGAHESFCILVSDARKPESRERLGVLEESSDGFRIAEADLALRGPGELLGKQQSGALALRFGDLSRDLELIRRARAIVEGK